MKYLLGYLLSIALIAALFHLLRSAGERWCMCRWCRRWFSDRGHTSDTMPPEWDGTVILGKCTACQHQEVDAYLKQITRADQNPAGSMKD